MGYSQAYIIYIYILLSMNDYYHERLLSMNDDCSRLSHVWPTTQFLAIFEKSEWPRMIESRVCIYLFNDLAQIFPHSIITYFFYCMLYEYIWSLLNIFPTIINSYHILLTSTVDVFCCLLFPNPGHLFSDADTFPLGHWSLWSSGYILYIRYKYVPTYFWIIYSDIFYWAGRTYVQYCVRKLYNVN